MMQIRFKHVTFLYNARTPAPQVALKEIDLTCDTNQIIGVCGTTGSGKSTFIRHLNGILKPTSGQIIIDGEDLHQSKETLRRIRQRIGMTFQFPERQFFGRTVWEELAYTLEHHHLPEEEIERRIFLAARALHFDISHLRDRSPFSLSRGDQRLLGIAAMLTLQPELIVLDEPTAGMDRKHAIHLLSLLQSLHREQNMHLILASHDLELLFKYTEELIILHQGKILWHGSTRQALGAAEFLERNGIMLPLVQRTLYLLQQKYPHLRIEVNDVNNAVAEILKTSAPSPPAPLPQGEGRRHHVVRALPFRRGVGGEGAEK